MKLNENTAHKLDLLAIDVQSRANDYRTVSHEANWHDRATRLDRAARLLAEAAELIRGSEQP